ncbi:hypothetical protein KP509_27G040400 [Ceratopteris richardii]|uniref:Uncharacterized protein n=1 Tax=Ceratopteris richardii TaxID=49495 RepID=A0A8T2RIA1_CERRI|nr:hypothetical protein KP509_27G040400 [Ceratopteris richardii]KAH7295263.1 hypothetical protein KP509_27G040400 [Ceratopteris richardii]KAH7295266.1 hypothetical protein KP509_27G040400 [Ceratopteris richardii]
MAQCHAERRKHPSAMDYYVGAFHSKLYSPNRDADKYHLWTTHQTSCTPLSTSRGHPSQSCLKEPPVVGKISSSSGSLRGSTLMVGPSSDVKSLSDLGSVESYVKAVRNDTEPAKTTDSTTQSFHQLDNGIADTKSSIVRGNGTATPSKSSNTCRSKGVGDPPNGNGPDQLKSKDREADSVNSVSMTLCNNNANNTSPNGTQPSKNNAGQVCPKPSIPSKSNSCGKAAPFPRIHKSAELSLTSTSKGNPRGGNVDPPNRLFKSGEQLVSKSKLNAGNSRECLTGGLVVGCQKSASSSSSESFCGENPNGSKESRRWSSADSSGSPDSFNAIGGSPMGKESGKKVFTSNGSCDGAILCSKDVLANDHRDADKRFSTTGNSINNRDAAIARGMGNILIGANSHGSGKVKCPNSKVIANDMKSGDGSSRKADDPATMTNNSNVKGLLGVHGSIDGMPNRIKNNNLCTGNRNNCVSGGNILNGVMAPRNNSKLEDSRHVSESVDPEDIKNSGNIKYKMGNFAEALALYDKSILLSPYHAPYRSNRAAALAGLGRLGEAVLECEEAIKLDSCYVRAHQRAVHLYLRLGLVESAKRHIQALAGKDDGGVTEALLVVERHISRCIEARKSGDWQKGLQESSKAIIAGADSAAQILGYKAEALLKLHKLDEASTMCEEAQRLEDSLQKLGIAPADSFLHMLQASIELQRGKFDAAIEAAHAAVKIDPRNLDAVGLLKKARVVDQCRISGNELFKSGRFFEACAIYGEGLESDPTNAVLLCNRAACRSKLGQWEKAIEDCNASLGAQPNYIKALMRRAHCSVKLERWEDALQDYEVLRARMPNDKEVAQAHFDVQTALKKSRDQVLKEDNIYLSRCQQRAT